MNVSIIGLGGCGRNVVDNLIMDRLTDVHFIVVDADACALDNSLTENTIQLGARTSKSLGCACNEKEKAMVIEALPQVMAAIAPSSVVVFIAGLGRKTGTSAVSIFTDEAIKSGKKVITVVTTPFQYETKERNIAQAALKDMQRRNLPVLEFRNDDLYKIADKITVIADVFRVVDKEIFKLIAELKQHNFNLDQITIPELLAPHETEFAA